MPFRNAMFDATGQRRPLCPPNLAAGERPSLVARSGAEGGKRSGWV